MAELIHLAHAHVGVADDVGGAGIGKWGLGEAGILNITRGTSMWMSMRSSKGPEMRFWYLATTAGAQVQGFWLSP